ncbi:nitrate reductase cytochrome c-type subunit [Shewanella sp. AS1]|uniref:nitrate reductase cytochrome c-type subunit n=1 Tax=Shewanella sp. AS1 TaxID=2907626 RepID=UPI001F2D7098|nr:nitrate reductase cytochrome c-type subunit [Shewanella sp. AS1]MCE9679294.1 nitrate reductase cytochrome c-type subunit [Shewanella sp. AS1]
MKKILTLVALMALGACSGQQTNEQTEPVNIDSLGKAKLTEVRPADAMPSYPSKGQSIERTFAHQPPLIPHKADYPITLKKNGCMSCHSSDKAKRMKATPIFSKHLKADNSLDDHFYNCNQCHVPQADNKTELVGNEFSR